MVFINRQISPKFNFIIIICVVTTKQQPHVFLHYYSVKNFNNKKIFYPDIDKIIFKTIKITVSAIAPIISHLAVSNSFEFCFIIALIDNPTIIMAKIGSIINDEISDPMFLFNFSKCHLLNLKSHN